MNIKFIIFIIIGIILFFIFNKNDTFSVGVPWILVDSNYTPLNVDKLNGEPFLCTEEICFQKYEDVEKAFDERRTELVQMRPLHEPTDEPVDTATAYYIVRDTEPNYYRVDLDKCQNPHNKLSGNLFTAIDIADSEWRNKTRQNYETLPLLPRKNLKFKRGVWPREPIENLTESRLYNPGDIISYSCDTEKTQSKPTHNIKCKPRRKFLIQAHGIIDEDSKTIIPQLFQLKLYKTYTNKCISNTHRSRFQESESIIRGNNTVDYYDEDYPSITALAQRLDHPMNVQSNKAYLAVLESRLIKKDRPIEELVYDELSHLNSGKLYISLQENRLLSKRVGSSDIDIQYSNNFLDAFYLKIGDFMYSFYTDEIINDYRWVNTNLVSFLNPFMFLPTMLHDSDDTTNLDILQLKRGNPNLDTTKMDFYNFHINGFYPRKIYPNGVVSSDLFISNADLIKDEYSYGTPKIFESPHTEENPWVIPDDMFQGELNDVEKQAIYKQVSDRQKTKYGAEFKDKNEISKPIFLYKYKITYNSALEEYLKDTVKALVQSCCVSIDSALLSPEFKYNSDIINRLFPIDRNGNRISREFPLLYFDLYLRDGFIHRSNTPLSLDQQDGEYTSSDLRYLVSEIITQIYVGSKSFRETDLNTENYGYYQLFKQKMMLEKGYNNNEVAEKLHELYVVHGNPNSNPKIFKKLDWIKIKLKNRYLCSELLQKVWGNYGYDYYNDNDYESYSFSIDVPLILAKLFKTEIGESADFHAIACIEDEDTNFRSIQKNGYWGCEDNGAWKDSNNKNCNYYNNNTIDNKTSIEKCREWGDLGANDNCCICKMVQNINEKQNFDLKPKIGPQCKVKECKQTLEQKNLELHDISPVDNMGIIPEEWTKTNTWPEYMPSRTEGPGDNEPRKMEHVETAFRYVYDTSDADYGKMKLITEPNHNGVLRESSPIEVLCNYTEIEEGRYRTHPYRPEELGLPSVSVAGNIKCDNADSSDQNSDIANYTGDLECPREDDLDLCATFIEEYFKSPVTAAAAAALAMQSGGAAAGGSGG